MVPTWSIKMQTPGKESASNIEIEILESLKRILAGKPNNPDLAERLKRGDSILSIKSVALEAGVSRTLIGFDGCVYPNARQSILEALARAKEGKATDSVVRQLRSEIKELNEGLKRRDAYIAELVIENSRLRERYEPAAQKGSNVTPLRRDGRRSSPR